MSESAQLGTCFGLSHEHMVHTKNKFCLNFQPVEQASVSPPKSEDAQLWAKLIVDEIFGGQDWPQPNPGEYESEEEYGMACERRDNLVAAIIAKYAQPIASATLPDLTPRFREKQVGEHREDKSAPAMSQEDADELLDAVLDPDFLSVQCDKCDRPVKDHSPAELKVCLGEASAGEPTEAGKPAEPTPHSEDAAEIWLDNYTDGLQEEEDVVSLARAFEAYAASLQPQVTEKFEKWFVELEALANDPERTVEPCSPLYFFLQTLRALIGRKPCYQAGAHAPATPKVKND